MFTDDAKTRQRIECKFEKICRRHGKTLADVRDVVAEAGQIRLHFGQGVTGKKYTHIVAAKDPVGACEMWKNYLTQVNLHKAL